MFPSIHQSTCKHFHPGGLSAHNSGVSVSARLQIKMMELYDMQHLKMSLQIARACSSAGLNVIGRQGFDHGQTHVSSELNLSLLVSRVPSDLSTHRRWGRGMMSWRERCAVACEVARSVN